MEESTSKEKVLKKVRNALIHKSKDIYPNVDFNSNIYTQSDDPDELNFAKNFTAVGGKFLFCISKKDFAQHLNDLIRENKWENLFCGDDDIKKILKDFSISFRDTEAGLMKTDVGITGCEYLVARTGSIVVSSRQTSGRRSFVFPPVHLVLAYISQIVPDMKEALMGVKNKYGVHLPSMISAITGASRTADIEKTLVTGAHGPKELFVFLIDDEQ